MLLSYTYALQRIRNFETSFLANTWTTQPIFFFEEKERQRRSSLSSESIFDVHTFRDKDFQRFGSRPHPLQPTPGHFVTCHRAVITITTRMWKSIESRRNVCVLTSHNICIYIVDIAVTIPWCLLRRPFSKNCVSQ